MLDVHHLLANAIFEIQHLRRLVANHSTTSDAYGASPTEPLWSLLLNPNLSKLPRTWIVACSKDPTHDEMLMFTDKLKKEGIDVSLEVCEGYPHFFWMLPMLQKSQEFMGKWVEQIRQMVA
jgi:acetyl esterase/lipase